MILLSSPLKNGPPETTASIFFFEIEIVTTKTVNSKSLKKICRQLLSTMNILKMNQKCFLIGSVMFEVSSAKFSKQKISFIKTSPF